MNLRKLLCPLLGVLLFALSANAQIGEIVNGLTNVAIPALTRGAGYKGYLEADLTFGVGTYRTNFLTLATSQGYKFNDWFYMGAGIGVDFLWSKINGGWGEHWADQRPEWYRHEHTTSAVMIPVFTDFRFIFGSQTQTSFFLNFRLGAAFLCSEDYVQIRDGYLTNRDYFYFQPAVGVRIPINRTKPRQAIDVGLHYRLMTGNYWSNWQRTASINGLGLNISYEW